MSENSTEAPRETPEVGLIADDDLPEDLQPTDDNPLAQDPDGSEGPPGQGDGPGDASQASVDGLPDVTEPA